MLGKRKRQSAVLRRELSPEDTDSPDHQLLLQQYFESRFQPLPKSEIEVTHNIEKQIDDDDSSDFEESEWEGLSEPETSPEIEVVEHGISTDKSPDDVERPASRSFMSPKPPRESGQSRKKGPAQTLEKDDSETLNLKHDLDLQRLLKESHLLEQAKAMTNSATHQHKTTDMRLQSLGSKTSLFNQEKMPLSHRRGITAKAGAKEALRRKEAKENGVVLEKATTSPLQSRARRDRGVDAPSLGKFRGGTLKLSRNDIANIQGPRKPSSRSRGRAR